MNCKILCFVLLLFVQSFLSAQELNRFEQYNTDDGLSDNFATSLIHDQNGFLWITTFYGINRFDGSYFRKYASDEYPHILRNDFKCSVTDSAGRMLFGAADGIVVRYNPRIDNFDTVFINDFYSNDFVSVDQFFTTKNKELLALTTSGIYKFDYKKDVFSNSDPVFANMGNLRIRDLFVDCKNRFWIAAQDGVYVFDEKGEKVAKLPFLEPVNSEAFCFVQYNDSLLFIGSSSFGLWKLTISKNGKISEPKKIDSPFTEVSCFLKTSKGKLLIGTRTKGLWYIDINTDNIQNASFKPVNTNHKAVNAMYEEKNGDIWLCMHGEGLVRYPKLIKNVAEHSQKSDFPKVIVSSFVQDKNGALWVGTDGDGLYKLNKNLSIEKHLSMSDELKSNGILSLDVDNDNAIWMATWGGGVCKLNQTSNRFTHWTSFNSSLLINNYKSIIYTSQGSVLAGSHGEGLCYLPKDQDSWITHKNSNSPVYSFKSYPWLNQIIETRNGVFWVATVRELWRIEKDTFRKILIDSSGRPSHQPLLVNCIAANKNGDVVAATSRGVVMISAEGSEMQKLDFLSGGIYFNVVFDSNDRCWVAGTNGLFLVDIKNKKTTSIELPKQCFKGNYFTSRAIYCDADGQILIGGVDGFLIINPDSVNNQQQIQTVSFSDLYISSIKIVPGTETLPEHLSYTHELRLNYDQTNIRIDFDVVSFNHVKCAYILEGIDKDWNLTGNDRQIVFSHIPPGTYTLRIKAWNPNNESDSKSASLTIIVSPPWWKSLWFKILSVVVVVVLVIAVIWFRTRTILQQNIKLENQVNERTQELKNANIEISNQNKSLSEKQFVIEMKNDELSRTLSTKDRLLSIIAHDLKNPMFAIVAMLSQLKSRFDNFDNEKKYKMVDNLLESSTLLQNEMVNLLEWATVQQKAVLYAPQPVDLQVIISDTLSLLKQTAKIKAIEIEFQKISTPIVEVDAHMIATTIRNLVSNAIKFTPENGKIIVKLQQTNENIQVIVADSGIGMSTEQIELCFDDEVYTSTRGTQNEKGTGLGLKICKEFIARNNGTISVDSTPGVGTSFIISLPLDKVITPDTFVPKKNPEVENSVINEQLFKIDRSLLEGNTILIIDDNPVVRQHLHNIISPYTTVVEAEDGLTGLEIALNSQPDIIISDIDMPKKDGIELCRDIAASPQTWHIPVVLLTARSETQHKLEGLQSGAIDYLTKPFNETELLMKLSNVITVRRNQQQNILFHKNEKLNVTEKMHPFLKKFMTVIEDNYKKADLTMEEIASILAMSKATLSRKLSTIIDKTPLELLNEFRLQKAKELLRENKLNVSEIAYEVGFNDPRYFSRKFKEFFGESPSSVSGIEL